MLGREIFKKGISLYFIQCVLGSKLSLSIKYVDVSLGNYQMASALLNLWGDYPGYTLIVMSEETSKLAPPTSQSSIGVLAKSCTG